MLHTYLNHLHHLISKENCSLEEIKQALHSPYSKEHELAHATCIFFSKKYGLPFEELVLRQSSSGAVLLYERGFFPWGAFPYPREHAELGAILAKLEEYKEISRKMVHFQQATLDHTMKPIYSLFQQEQGCFFQELEQANRKFFDAVDVKFSESCEFLDADLGFISKREDEKTLVLSASGCKSGMGAYLIKDVGVINFAPQLVPVGDCRSFGLSMKAKNLTMHSDERKCSISYENRLSSAHPRTTGLSWLTDSGYSAFWMSAQLQFQDPFLRVGCEIEGFKPLSQVVFSFFCKGKMCYIAKSHKLNPRSLDRYLGPTQIIELKGDEGSLFLQAEKGISQMEVIPLAGDNSFWGADFLVTFSLQNRNIEFYLGT